MAEDLMLAQYLDGPTGFYVDIGAFHPVQFSNTWFFYKRGWRGINVDASLAAVNALAQKRPRDINLQRLIGRDQQDVTFYEFEQRELNTCLASELPSIKKYHGQVPLRKTRMTTVSLARLLDEHLPAGTVIDFMNIDTEGADEMVLRSNNWEKYRPRFLVVERHLSFEDFYRSELYGYLRGLQYQLCAFCKHAFIWQLRQPSEGL